MTEVDFLAAMEAWYRRRAEPLRASGIGITIGRTEGDRPKHARWVGARNSAADAELIVWDTGEAEFGIARPGMPNVDEHHEISSVAQLEELLERLVASVRPT
jgi:hypothetical protein